jgi:hypothetical protein
MSERRTNDLLVWDRIESRWVRESALEILTTVRAKILIESIQDYLKGFPEVQS